MRPRMMRFEPGVRSLSLPSRIEPAMDDTFGSRPGSMPRTMAPLIDGGRLSMASVSRKGGGAHEAQRPLQLPDSGLPVFDRRPTGVQACVRRQAQQAGA